MKNMTKDFKKYCKISKKDKDFLTKHYPITMNALATIAKKFPEVRIKYIPIVCTEAMINSYEVYVREVTKRFTKELKFFDDPDLIQLGCNTEALHFVEMITALQNKMVSKLTHLAASIEVVTESDVIPDKRYPCSDDIICVAAVINPDNDPIYDDNFKAAQLYKWISNYNKVPYRFKTDYKIETIRDAEDCIADLIESGRIAVRRNIFPVKLLQDAPCEVVQAIVELANTYSMVVFADNQGYDNKVFDDTYNRKQGGLCWYEFQYDDEGDYNVICNALIKNHTPMIVAEVDIGSAGEDEPFDKGIVLIINSDAPAIAKYITGFAHIVDEAHKQTLEYAKSVCGDINPIVLYGVHLSPEAVFTKVLNDKAQCNNGDVVGLDIEKYATDSNYAIFGIHNTNVFEDITKAAVEFGNEVVDDDIERITSSNDEPWYKTKVDETEESDEE